MQCKLIGTAAQCLSVTLEPGEILYCEAGSIVSIDQQLQTSVELSDVSRFWSGESWRQCEILNPTNTALNIVISGQLTHLMSIKSEKDNLYVRPGAYVASTRKPRIHATGFQYVIKAGMSLQLIENAGTLFIEHVGDVIVKDLAVGEVLLLDENHLIATVGVEEKRLVSKWKLKNILSGEGLSLFRITGPGKIYYSPISLPNTKDRSLGCFSCIIILIIIGIMSILL